MNAKHEEVTCLLNFGGFYCYHDEYIDTLITHLEINTEDVDYQTTYQNYARAWIDQFNSELNLSLEYVDINSPLYYNYTTDKLNVKLKGEEADRLVKEYLQNEKFKSYADYHLTSRSGFISFYDGLDDLLERSESELDEYELLVNLILDFMVIDTNINALVYELEYDIVLKAEELI